ncbi:MAG: RNA polymerase factor sigma-54 [Bacteroidota bacterium]
MKQQQNQSQQLRQGYYLSQHHMKLMHIMHLSGYALQEYIAIELEQNPVLEKESETETDDQEEIYESDDSEVELDIWNEDEDLLEKSYKQSLTQAEYYEAPVVQYYSLHESLKEQIHMMKLNDNLASVCCFIVDELDDDGYLRRPVDDVAYDLSFSDGKLVPGSRIEEGLQWVQKCEPAGVGARDLKECLYLQLLRMRRTGNIINEIALRIFEVQYQNLIHHNYNKLKAALNISDEQFNSTVQHISKLNPKPATDANRYELLKEQIIPEFEVIEDDGKLYASLTSSEYSGLYVNPQYHVTGVDDLKNNSEKRQAENYFQNLVTEANSLISALKERETTMSKIIITIVGMQSDFFRSGDYKQLRPMILQDIANATGYDISSVSRITSNKHVQTAYGIFALKSLFMRGLNTENSPESSLTAVKVQEFIQEIINGEDKNHPYSDTMIASLLKEKGAVIARRTVVKYRELMNIPNSTMRKDH